MSLPDGPRTPPTLQLIQWIANPLSFMRNCSSMTARLCSRVPFLLFGHQLKPAGRPADRATRMLRTSRGTSRFVFKCAFLRACSLSCCA